MFQRIRYFLSDYCGLLVLLGWILAGLGFLVSIWYAQTHSTYQLEQGVKVNIVGQVSYRKDDPQGGGPNQFFAFNELGVTGMSMQPRFTLINESDKPCKVRLHSLSAWKVPVSGTIHLEPGQEFTFEISASPGCKHWYCWIHPEEVIAKKF